MFTIEEQQILISTNFAAVENRGTTIKEIEKAGIAYFCSYKLDWNEAFGTLFTRGALVQNGADIKLNDELDISAMTRRRPRYKYWYNDWYRFADDSLAHSKLCKFAYGIDLCQTGMMTKKQIDFLCNSSGVKGHGIDLGCGLGKITEQIAAETHSTIVGIDTILLAIKKARERTLKNNMVSFELSDMRHYIATTDSVFDYLIAMDTLYFLGRGFGGFLLNSMKKVAVRGIMYLFYSAWIGKDNQLGPTDNNLGKFLVENHCEYEYIDFTEDDCDHWSKKRAFLVDNKNDFVAEGMSELQRRRLSEAEVLDGLAKEKKMKRYLYMVKNIEI